ncbi:acyltransferase-domain-containing protein [Panus rudis PR-1116 ss-1]|nr:acyltransferase-domain-containing protein [Panus rudis PR-1116 ss-1]
MGADNSDRQPTPALHTIPIAKRPRKTWSQTLNALLFVIVFDVACLMINGFQFTVLLPIRLIPFSTSARKLYDEGIRYSKGAFGTLLILMCQWFAPTKLLISFEREGLGSFSSEEIEQLVVRDKSGKVAALRLPQKSVLIANHQIYADWWYAWCLTYFMGTHKDVYIVLKKSLKWAPIVGWGMQFYDFIFLARSWASDRLHLSKSLAWLGRRAEKEDLPLTFILYPEGTLVSEDTRPVSKKYADKLGIPDMQHTLLPRSTGLHYSLRSLAPKIPRLQMIDITMAYPGIPPFGYGQAYYTLRSIFCDRVPPPVVHMHIRCYDVAKEVPIGDLSSSHAQAIPSGGAAKYDAVEISVPEKERERFDLWLRERWREKDEQMSRFLETGSMVSDNHSRVEIPLEVRHKREILDAFCFFIPALVGWVYSKLR